MVAGNGSAMVYARPGEPRPDRWPIERLRRAETFGGRGDMVAALVREPAVAFLAAESDRGGIWLGGGDGEARLRRRGDAIDYEPMSGDPLRMGGRWTGGSREYLKASWNGAFPDAAFHLMDQFRTSRSGDLLVVARQGYDFRARFELPEHRAGHGSLIRSHMQTPVWASQPMPSGPLRTVDLFPAMLAWLGVAIPAGIDGEPVWGPGRRSDVRSHPREAVFAE
jgi:hypothetical protein